MSKNCGDPSCSVHSRNDLTIIGEYGFPVMITYCGDYAVYTDTALYTNNMTLTERLLLANDLMEIVLNAREEDVREEAVALVKNNLISYTSVYGVGEGSIDDYLDDNQDGLFDPIYKIEHCPEESSDIHFREVSKISGTKSI